MSSAVSPRSVEIASQSQVLLTVKAVARMLGCSPRHVVRLTEAGHLPASVRLGTLVRWRKDEVEQWIAAGCPQADGGAA